MGAEFDLPTNKNKKGKNKFQKPTNVSTFTNISVYYERLNFHKDLIFAIFPGDLYQPKNKSQWEISFNK